MPPHRASSPAALAAALAWAALGACATAAPRVAAPPPAASDAARAGAGKKALAALLADHWEYFLARQPEFASSLGDLRYNDRWSDQSAAGVATALIESRAYLARFRALDTFGLSEQEALTRTLMIRSLQDELEAARFEDWKMPVDQMGGIHLRAARLPSQLRFQTAKDFEDWTTRLRHLPRQLEDAMDNMRLGMAAGLMPPRILLEKVASQAADIAAAKPEETPFAQCLARLPEALRAADRERLRGALLDAVRDGVLPAYARFARFVKEEYAPRGRAEVGMWALPDGAARYAFYVRESTTSALSPEAIHELGLREVSRIEVEMRAAAQAAGFADLAAFRAAVATDPKLRPTSRGQILDIYRGHLDAMRRELPRLFGRLPRAECEVVAVEAFREKAAAGAYYDEAAPDGSRPGRIQVNTSDFASRSIIGMESTAYHEGVPGHHLQFTIQQELEALPPQRRFLLGYNAYSEGWALYAERLGREVGRFQDPASYYGHLEMEMLRAIRLVVDTGLHARRWSREEVVRFFHDHSAADEVEVQVETDRYIAWPGQALGYKVGQLHILALRERAARALGAAFDLRAFHDLVLGAGSLPLDVLEARVAAWIATHARREAPGRAEVAPG